MTTLIVNYTELRFTYEVEMTRYLSQTEEIWNDEVMAMLLESGLQSKTVTQICNQSNFFLRTSFWVWNQKNLLKRFYWMPRAGRAEIFSTHFETKTYYKRISY